MTDMSCTHCRADLHAYLDNELEAPAALAIHRHLSECPQCQAKYQRMRQVTRLTCDNAETFKAPEQLRKKIALALRPQRQSYLPAWLSDIFAGRVGIFGPAFSLSALACAAFFYLATPAATNDWADEAVSDHVRSLMAQHVTDVASSDRHTVKPWFIGKLDFAPPVFDFTAQGFSLIGGRLDYLQSQTTAALVYEHNKHVINLFILPTDQPDSGEVDRLKKRGYNIVTWRKNHMQFIAVSDMDANGLAELAKLLQDGAS